jgi:hypothetical protein
VPTSKCEALSSSCSTAKRKKLKSKINLKKKKKGLLGLGMVVHACNPSSLGNGGRKIVSLGPALAK